MRRDTQSSYDWAAMIATTAAATSATSTMVPSPLRTVDFFMFMILPGRAECLVIAHRMPCFALIGQSSLHGLSLSKEVAAEVYAVSS